MELLLCLILMGENYLVFALNGKANVRSLAVDLNLAVHCNSSM